MFLAVIVGGYYAFFLNDFGSVVHSFTEYVSFIVLLGSLFVVTGGIHIKINSDANPYLNVLFLLFGAIVSNIIGTTGASVLLIRPFLRMNRNRIKAYHVVFFIFIVGNVGGALTPIGDPPLFLGFLRGVPFFWVIGQVWYIWLFALLLLLAVFFVFDKRSYGKLPPPGTALIFISLIKVSGARNLVFLCIIILAVFIDPKVLPWVPGLQPLPFGLRELLMSGAAMAAFFTADKNILSKNEFDFHPIKEVAFLFIGIFITMIPALQLIAIEARALHQYLTPSSFYWASGTLSSFLDNAPTYLNFLSASMGDLGLNIDKVSDVQAFTISGAAYLKAVSVGSVFFGAMTYIGNGPNFMVKSITERAGLKMPSFFAYMIYFSFPVLLPIFILVRLIFFR